MLRLARSRLLYSKRDYLEIRPENAPVLFQLHVAVPFNKLLSIHLLVQVEISNVKPTLSLRRFPESQALDKRHSTPLSASVSDPS
jgi:hypothetical protein